MGVYELLYDESIPPKVAISEAMRLAKKFGTPESATFVNALLDAIYKSSLGEQLDVTRLSESAKQLRKSEEIALEASLQESSTEQAEETEE